jgi:hypothetical protein
MASGIKKKEINKRNLSKSHQRISKLIVALVLCPSQSPTTENDVSNMSLTNQKVNNKKGRSIQKLIDVKSRRNTGIYIYIYIIQA